MSARGGANSWSMLENFFLKWGFLGSIEMSQRVPELTMAFLLQKDALTVCCAADVWRVACVSACVAPCLANVLLSFHKITNLFTINEPRVKVGRGAVTLCLLCKFVYIYLTEITPTFFQNFVCPFVLTRSPGKLSHST